MKNNFENKNKMVTKSQLIFIILINLFIFATIGMIVYENKSMPSIKYSYIMLGIVFVLMGINQLIYYKNNKTKVNLVQAIIYMIIGLAIFVFGIMK